MPAVRELTRPDDVATLAGGDPFTVWAAQGLGPAVRAWSCGEAVAVASPDLVGQDRLAVCGPAGQVAVLVRHALTESGPSHAVSGDHDLVVEVADRLGLSACEPVGWMDTRHPPEGDTSPQARWLPPDRDRDVDALLDIGFPSSFARPGGRGVRRWAAITGPGGGLLAAVAEAWTVAQVGFIGGVVTHPAHRGRGHASAVCGLLLRDLLAEHDRAALLVDPANTAAIGLYRRLGLRPRAVVSAAAGDLWPRACASRHPLRRPTPGAFDPAAADPQNIGIR
ncbi:GNAT family N-acetyltransferase [Planomonospora sp. ID91781]|uniref:GNAT family N-acetyltransferase n=1 Tax=Planomonospora sp. ID91781 TaxID=2738135 RepID=UPI0018C3D620|nr:GNAT family N-acetyltransferase [Planomonospora sp. ID91781]MBG0823304.1 GNAT family N-acetyltransferase [Planomonospora sp. ID91781]